MAKYGPPVGKYAKPPVERFWAKVDKSGECWLWTAYRDSVDGYGRFTLSHAERGRLAHRVSFELAYGPIPDGLLVCHHCDNPPCVNPTHLFLGTDLDNSRDKIAKGRGEWGRGEANSQARLTAADVDEIRKLRGLVTQRELARRFGVSRGTIGMLMTRRNWGHR